jgi:hypothetical protein
MPAVELQQRLLADLHQFAVPRHARWDPLGLMGVRESLRDRLSALGEPCGKARRTMGDEVGSSH